MTDSEQIQSNELLPTPPLPENLPGVDLSENAHQVISRRYRRKGENGALIETVEEMFWRVAYHVAKVETGNPISVDKRAQGFYHLLAEKKFFPNSPTFTGAGTPLGQLSACFVLPISDDMGRREDGIFSTLRNAALIQQTGGGNGFSFSRLRPSGARVKSSAGIATGPIGFLRVYDQAFDEVAQGGTRRGANMGTLRVDHPDIEEFVTCKTDENAITNFNISVGITDAFMEAVNANLDWELRFPDETAPGYQAFNGDLDEAIANNIPVKVHKVISARELFDKIVTQAHHNGEPGLLFIDAANRDNPVPHLYPLESTNPCGEQWLGPFENCCLASINLAEHLGAEHTVDWQELQKTVETATIFLDDVIDANAYVPAVPQLKEAALNSRRIGLGIMGLGDLLYHTQIPYGSKEGQEFSAQVMEFIRYHTMLTSIKLAEERGCFPAIKGSLYDPEDMRWTPPTPLFPYENNYNRPEINWEKVIKGIRKHGIRNAAQTTIAPTGTIATIAGCEGYGCEPVFALAYIRHVNDNGKDLTLNYISPNFLKELDACNFDAKTRAQILEKILETGSCQDVDDLPPRIRNVFVVSSDITAEEHVRMQAALQAFVDNSLSKTINFPSTATTEDVAQAYMLAWELGCKGITVYVTGSRDQVVLETKSTAKSKQTENSETTHQLPIWHDTVKPRQRSLKGFTNSIETPLGKTYVTINENGENQPFEVFINTAKAGTETAAHSEAIGRLISYILRLASPVEPRKRLKAVMEQLSGIGGSRSLGFGANRILSLPDGIAKALDSYLYNLDKDIEESNLQDQMHDAPTLPLSDLEPNEDQKPQLNRGLCPECGHASLVNEEGCRKCYSCGYSEC